MKTKWLIYSIVGLLLIGFGLSLLGEAIKFKINQDFNWFYVGTLALIVFNSGVWFVGEAMLLKSEMSKNVKRH